MVDDLSQVMCKDSEPGVIDIISTEPGAGGKVVVVSAAVVVVCAAVVVVCAAVVVVCAAVVVVSTTVSLEEVEVVVEASSELEQPAAKRIKNTTVNKRFMFLFNHTK